MSESLIAWTGQNPRKPQRPEARAELLTVGQIVSLWYSIRGVRFDGKPIIRSVS